MACFSRSRDVVWHVSVNQVMWSGMFQSIRGCGVACFSRSGDVVEPRLKEQWFLSCQQMAHRAVQVIITVRAQWSLILLSAVSPNWSTWLTIKQRTKESTHTCMHAQRRSHAHTHTHIHSLCLSVSLSLCFCLSVCLCLSVSVCLSLSLSLSLLLGWR